MVQRFNHIGMCVYDIDETFKWMEKTMGAKMLSRTEYPDRHQISAMVVLADGVSKFELLSPLGEEGTIYNFLQKNGEGFHHVSLFTDDMEESISDFENEGGKIIGKTQGIAFVHPKTSHGMLIELADGTFKKK